MLCVAGSKKWQWVTLKGKLGMLHADIRVLVRMDIYCVCASILPQGCYILFPHLHFRLSGSSSNLATHFDSCTHLTPDVYPQP